MTTDKLSPSWPGTDDRTVIAQMLSNPDSEQWNKCYEYVKLKVQSRARNIPQDRWEDITQEVMKQINTYLPAFQYKSKLTTWIYSIVRSYIVNEIRGRPPEGIHIIPLVDSQDENEDEVFPTHMLGPEDENIRLEELHEVQVAIEEYLSLHSNQERNRCILKMVFIDGYSHKDAAKATGCSAAVASYVVRSAQEYVRKKLGIEKPQKHRQ